MSEHNRLILKDVAEAAAQGLRRAGIAVRR